MYGKIKDLQVVYRGVEAVTNLFEQFSKRKKRVLNVSVVAVCTLVTAEKPGVKHLCHYHSASTVCLSKCVFICVCVKKKKKVCGLSVFECASVSIVLAYVHQFKGNKVCLCMCMHVCVHMYLCVCGS